MDHIAGQEKSIPHLFPISSLQHFTVMVGITVCGREWLKHLCDFCPLRFSAACKPTLTRSFSSPLGPPLYGTSAVIGFVGSWLCWGREALLQFILEGFPYMCEPWFLHLTHSTCKGVIHLLCRFCSEGVMEHTRACWCSSERTSACLMSIF